MEALDLKLAPRMRPFVSQTQRFASGQSTPRDFLEACLAEIDAHEKLIGASAKPTAGVGERKFVKIGETYYQPIEKDGKQMYEVVEVK